MFYKIVCTQVTLILLSVLALAYGIFGDSPNASSWEMFGLNNTVMISISLGLCILSRHLGKSIRFAKTDLNGGRVYEVLKVWKSGDKHYALFRPVLGKDEAFWPTLHSPIIVELYEQIPPTGHNIVPYLGPDNVMWCFKDYDGVVSTDSHGDPYCV